MNSVMDSTADSLKGKTSTSESELKLNGGSIDDGDAALDCDDAGVKSEFHDGENARNGNGEVDDGGEDDDDDDLSSDIGLIEDDEDLDEMAAAKSGELKPNVSLEQGADVEMADDQRPAPANEEKHVNGPTESSIPVVKSEAQPRSESRLSTASDGSGDEVEEEPEIVEHVVKLVVNQLVNVVSLSASAYRGANTLKRRRQVDDEDDLIDEIEEGDIESRIKCIDILHNRHEQIRLKREQRSVLDV